MSKCQVRVTSTGTNGVPLLKTLRLVGSFGIRDAKDLSDFLRDSTPCLLVAGVDRDVADHICALLCEAGADVAIEESSIDVPMLLCPRANRRYRWSWFSGPTAVEG